MTHAMPEEAHTPPLVIEIAIEPKSKADQEKLGVALAKLANEDPSFGMSTDHESGQTILRSVSERHLEASPQDDPPFRPAMGMRA